jgi:Flp pilus assembly protein CpaB
MAETAKPSLLTRKDWRVLAVAVGLGVVSVVLLNFYIRSREKSNEMVPVVVATKSIAAGSLITRGMLAEKLVPKGTLSGNVLSGGEDMDLASGQAVSVDVDKGQPMYWGLISAPLPEASMNRFLRWDLQERAYAIDFPGSFASRIQPGDKIDIYGTMAGDKTTFQLLPAVTVIEGTGNTLIVSVTPDEAMTLTMAKNLCTMTFTLRSEEETGKDTDLEPMSVGDFLRKVNLVKAARIARAPTDDRRIPLGRGDR